MRPFPRLCLALAALSNMSALSAAPASSADNMRPGLWEMRQQPQLDAKRQAQLEQAQRAMASMPPEQRRQVEQMMAQNGLSIDVANGGVTLKTCISKEQAALNTPPLTDKGQCSHDTRRSGNVVRVRFTCTDPASEGESEVTLNGSEGFSTRTRVTTTVNGRSETMNISGQARWLGSDCAGLKPQPMPSSPSAAPAAPPKTSR